MRSAVALVIACALSVAPVRADDADLAVKAQAILKTHCYRCHGQLAKGDFKHVLDRDKLVANKHIVPGKPAASDLFERMRDSNMPPPEVKTSRPSKEDVALIEQWITAGAPAWPRTSPARVFVSESELQQRILADLQTVPPLERRFMRYLSLVQGANAGWSDADLDSARQALVKLLNSLSWHARPHLPHAVDPARALFRIDLRAVKWTGRLWDRMLAFYPYRMPASSAARSIAAATGSEVPYVRADWFIATAARPPLYYDLLDLPGTDRGLERLLQVDAARDIEELSVARAGFNGSGVSNHNRLIERHDAAHGAYWKTYDFSANTERQNLFEHPLGPPPAGNAFVHAGGEMIYHLPNGLLAFFVTDGGGRRIDRAPVEIVSDPQRPDKAVEAGLSCFACHGAGFIPKSDQVRAHVLKNAQAFARADLETVQALYPTDDKFRALVAQDSQRYLQALERLGVKKDGPEPLTAVTLRYEGTLDLANAAAETGLPPTEFAERLRRDPALGRALGALLANGTVQRQTFLTAFPQLVGESSSPIASVTPTFAVQGGSILAIAIAPAGQQALTGSDDRIMRLWDVDSGRPVRLFQGHRAAITAVAFAADGRRAVSGSHDRTVRVWNLETGNQLHVLSGHTEPVTCVAFSPDGKRLLSAGQDRAVLLWDADAGKELRAFTGHAGRISSVAFSPDGKLALSGSHDRTACLWDVETGRVVRVLGGLGGEIYTVAFSPDGKTIATAGNDRVVRLWSAATGEELRRLEGHANAVIQIAFTPDGRSVLSASSQYQGPDRTIRVWDAASGQEKRSWAGPERERVSCAAFAPAGTLALTDGADLLRRWPLGSD